MAEGRLALTVSEFCEQAGIGKTLFYRAMKIGEGPKTMRVGGRVLIAYDSALAWLRSREDAAHERPQPSPEIAPGVEPAPDVTSTPVDASGSNRPPRRVSRAQSTSSPQTMFSPRVFLRTSRKRDPF